MNEKLRKAIRNNNDLYEAVFKEQNLNFRRNDSICYTLEKTPPLYSNLVTISPDWKPDEIFRTIDKNFEKEGWEEWSIKDSFAWLDLSVENFKKLFDAQWFYLKAGDFAPVETSAKLNYKIADNEKVLAEWRIAWDADESLGREIFHPKMLDNPKVFFVAACKGEKIVSGCLVNKTEDVLGVSNFFAPADDIEYWSQTIQFIYDSINFADIVGYERKSLLTKLLPLGFEAVGALSVWLRKKI